MIATGAGMRPTEITGLAEHHWNLERILGPRSLIDFREASGIQVVAKHMNG